MATTLTYADAAIDPLTGDLELPTRLIRGEALVIQRIQARLATHLGEWPLDTDYGLDYAGWAGTVPPPLDAIALAITEILGTTPGVARISNVLCSFDAATRSVRYQAALLLGEADDGTTPVSPLSITTFVTGAGASRILIAPFRAGAIIP
jgi:hypothetical protein